MMGSPFARTCDRCGEAFAPQDGKVLEIGYETLGSVGAENPGGSHIWRTLDLCPGCQHDLRNEFYRRGLTKDA